MLLPTERFSDVENLLYLRSRCIFGTILHCVGAVLSCKQPAHLRERFFFGCLQDAFERQRENSIEEHYGAYCCSRLFSNT